MYFAELDSQNSELIFNLLLTLELFKNHLKTVIIQGMKIQRKYEISSVE